jgi:hypothetical protein
MKRISNKVRPDKFMYGTMTIFLTMFILALEMKSITGNPWSLILIPLSLPAVGLGSIMFWNMEFRYASFKEKREMAIALNKPTDFGY